MSAPQQDTPAPTAEGTALAGAPSPPLAGYAWQAQAVGRHAEGEAVGAIARSLGVHYSTVKRALERCGVTVIPRSHPRPPWAAEAARLYQAGQTPQALADAYGVSYGLVARVLRREGVTLRDRKAAAILREAGKPGREPREHPVPSSAAPGMPPSDRALTALEVADLCQVSLAVVAGWIRSGRAAVIDPPDGPRFPPAQLAGILALLAPRAGTGATAPGIHPPCPEQSSPPAQR